MTSTALIELLRKLDDLQQKQTSLERELGQSYRQMETLVALTTRLRLRAPLPPMRGWAISPDFAAILFDHIQTHRPQTLVELGSGVSTLIAGYALEQMATSRLVSIDHAETFSQAACEQVGAHGLSAQIEFRHAPLRPMEIGGVAWIWYALDTHHLPDDIDLLVVDGPPQFDNPLRMVRYPALPVLFERLRSGAFILVDDADRDDERQMTERWLREFPLDLVQSFPTEKGAALLRKR